MSETKSIEEVGAAELELYMTGGTAASEIALPPITPVGGPITDPQVAYIVRELRAVLNGNVSKLKIMIAVHQGVLIMRKFTKMTGTQKKELLLRSLRTLVDQAGMTEDDRLASQMLIDLTAEPVIDSLVFMASGQVKLKPGTGFLCCFQPQNDAPQ